MEWYLLALVSALILGVSDVIKKKALSRERTLQFVSTYYIVIFVMLLALLPGIDFYLTLSEWAFVVVKSVFVSVAAFTFMRLIRHYDLSEVEPLKNLSPALLLILGFIILKETPTIINISGILLLILGAYVLEADHKIIHLKQPLKLLKGRKVSLLLTYLVFISVCAVMDKIALRTIEVYTYYFLQIMFVAAIFIGVELMKKRGLGDVKLALRKDWLVIIIACLMMVVSDLLFLKAVAIPGALIVLLVPIRRISTLVSAFIGGELFHEKGLKLKISACIITLAGATLVIL